MKSLDQFLQKHRTEVINVSFLLYLVLFNGFVARTIASLYVDRIPNHGFGVLLVALIIIETVVLYRKMVRVSRRVTKETGIHPGNTHKSVFTLLWMGHVLVHLGLIIAAAYAFGVWPDHPNWDYVAFAITAMVILQTVLLVVYLVAILPGRNPKSSSEGARKNQEHWTDLALLFFVCIAFSVNYEGAMNALVIANSNGVHPILAFIVALFLFILLFLPSRFGLLHEEVLRLRTKQEAVRFILSLSTTAILATAGYLFL